MQPFQHFPDGIGRSRKNLTLIAMTADTNSFTPCPHGFPCEPFAPELHGPTAGPDSPGQSPAPPGNRGACANEFAPTSAACGSCRSNPGHESEQYGRPGFTRTKPGLAGQQGMRVRMNSHTQAQCAVPAGAARVAIRNSTAAKTAMPHPTLRSQRTPFVHDNNRNMLRATTGRLPCRCEFIRTHRHPGNKPSRTAPLVPALYRRYPA